MTRDEAFNAFLAAVDLHMPAHALEGRDAIRQAGVEYAHAAAQELLDRYSALVTETFTDRHLLDGAAASPPAVGVVYPLTDDPKGDTPQ